ncbi:vacuolar protein sorting protein VPS8 [Acrasis kona]|uniref:Vacuolar protein sorting protein VPS8 n=1 Tax=Acrasis kona TaxID=1008807 RepID=A0AAW2YU23_9EUKA
MSGVHGVEIMSLDSLLNDFSDDEDDEDDKKKFKFDSRQETQNVQTENPVAPTKNELSVKDLEGLLNSIDDLDDVTPNDQPEQPKLVTREVILPSIHEYEFDEDEKKVIDIIIRDQERFKKQNKTKEVVKKHNIGQTLSELQQAKSITETLELSEIESQLTSEQVSKRIGSVKSICPSTTVTALTTDRGLVILYDTNKQKRLGILGSVKKQNKNDYITILHCVWGPRLTISGRSCTTLICCYSNLQIVGWDVQTFKPIFQADASVFGIKNVDKLEHFYSSSQCSLLVSDFKNQILTRLDLLQSTWKSTTFSFTSSHTSEHIHDVKILPRSEIPTAYDSYLIFAIATDLQVSVYYTPIHSQIQLYTLIQSFDKPVFTKSNHSQKSNIEWKRVMTLDGDYPIGTKPKTDLPLLAFNVDNNLQVYELHHSSSSNTSTFHFKNTLQSTQSFKFSTDCIGLHFLNNQLLYVILIDSIQLINISNLKIIDVIPMTHSFSITFMIHNQSFQKQSNHISLTRSSPLLFLFHRHLHSFVIQMIQIIPWNQRITKLQKLGFYSHALELVLQMYNGDDHDSNDHLFGLPRNSDSIRKLTLKTIVSDFLIQYAKHSISDSIAIGIENEHQDDIYESTMLTCINHLIQLKNSNQDDDDDFIFDILWELYEWYKELNKSQIILNLIRSKLNQFGKLKSKKIINLLTRIIHQLEQEYVRNDDSKLDQIQNVIMSIDLNEINHENHELIRLIKSLYLKYDHKLYKAYLYTFTNPISFPLTNHDSQFMNLKSWSDPSKIETTIDYLKNCLEGRLLNDAFDLKCKAIEFLLNDLNVICNSHFEQLIQLLSISFYDDGPSSPLRNGDGDDRVGQKWNRMEICDLILKRANQIDYYCFYSFLLLFMSNRILPFQSKLFHQLLKFFLSSRHGDHHHHEHDRIEIQNQIEFLFENEISDFEFENWMQTSCTSSFSSPSSPVGNDSKNQFIQSIVQIGFFKLAIYFYQRIGEFDKALLCHLQHNIQSTSSDNQSIFNFLKNQSHVPFHDLNHSQIKQAIITHFHQLLQKSAESTVEFIWTHYPDLHLQIIQKLSTFKNQKDLFIYLRCLFKRMESSNQIQNDDSKNQSSLNQEEYVTLRIKYILLMCEYDADQLPNYLIQQFDSSSTSTSSSTSSSSNHHLQWNDEILQKCKKYNIVDAVNLLYEKRGELIKAIDFSFIDLKWNDLNQYLIQSSIQLDPNDEIFESSTDDIPNLPNSNQSVERDEFIHLQLYNKLSNVIQMCMRNTLRKTYNEKTIKSLWYNLWDRFSVPLLKIRSSSSSNVEVVKDSIEKYKNQESSLQAQISFFGEQLKKATIKNDQESIIKYTDRQFNSKKKLSKIQIKLNESLRQESISKSSSKKVSNHTHLSNLWLQNIYKKCLDMILNGMMNSLDDVSQILDKLINQDSCPTNHNDEHLYIILQMLKKQNDIRSNWIQSNVFLNDDVSELTRSWIRSKTSPCVKSSVRMNCLICEKELAFKWSNDSYLKLFSCGHFFHSNCLDFKNASFCMLCTPHSLKSLNQSHHHHHQSLIKSNQTGDGMESVKFVNSNLDKQSLMSLYTSQLDTIQDHMSLLNVKKNHFHLVHSNQSHQISIMYQSLRSLIAPKPYHHIRIKVNKDQPRIKKNSKTCPSATIQSIKKKELTFFDFLKEDGAGDDDDVIVDDFGSNAISHGLIKNAMNQNYFGDHHDVKVENVTRNRIEEDEEDEERAVGLEPVNVTGIRNKSGVVYLSDLFTFEQDVDDDDDD